MTVVAVLDVGGTSIKSGVVRNASAVIGPSSPTLAAEPAEVVLDRLAACCSTALGLAGPNVAGIAIGFPGPFDVGRGTALIRGLHKFDAIHGVDLRAALRARVPELAAGLPVEFVHDNEAAGVGEAVFGAGRPAARVLTVTLGTGVGACLTSGGDVVQWVGELEVEKLARRSTPWGRADDVLSARGLADRLDVATLDLRAAVGDPNNTTVVAEHGSRVGEFLRSCVEELEVDLIVVGGGLVEAYSRFGPALEAALAPTRALPAELGAAGPILGAARLAFPDALALPPS